MNTPRCWSYVTCTITGGERAGTNLAALKTILARSRNCQLDLEIEVDGNPSAYALEAVSKILLPHMHRCQSLRFKACDGLIRFPPLFLEAPLKNLQHITVQWAPRGPPLDFDENNDAEESMLSFIAAPQIPLQSLTILADQNRFIRGIFGNIKTEALTQLRITVLCPTGKVLQLLQRCVALEHLDWVAHDMRAPLQDVPYPNNLELRNLISLRIWNEWGSPVGPSCALIAPQLTQIDLINSSNLPFDILLPDQPLLPSLTRVHALIPANNPDYLAAFLRRHPHITVCCLRTESMRTDVEIASVRAALDALVPDSQVAYHPRMRDFSLLTGDTTPADWEQVKASMQLVLEELPLLHIELILDKDV